MYILVLYDPQRIHEAQLVVLQNFEETVSFIRTHKEFNTGWKYHAIDTQTSAQREFTCPVYS